MIRLAGHRGGNMKILISDAFDPSLPEKIAAFGEVTEDKDRLAYAVGRRFALDRAEEVR